MEQRKLIQHGPSSLTFTLPTKWVKKNGLAKGDNVFFETKDNDLVISCNKKEETKKIQINISNLDRISILYYIESKYRAGYDEIEIVFDENKTIQYPSMEESEITSAIHYITSRFIGLEVVSQDKNRILLKRITKEDTQGIDSVLRRIFLMVKDTYETFIELIEQKKFDKLKIIKEKHDYINNLTNYCIRIISLSEEKNYPLHNILTQIDKLVDIIKYVTQDMISQKKVSKESIECFKIIKDSIDNFYSLYYSFDTKTIDSLNKNRWEIKQYILNAEASKFDIINMTRMEGITEIILDMTESRMSMEK
ncbi:hypothetical protein BVX95_01415 [archaeon D22]|nr:hypothetical protein BVX95_01415 [archaeon D22]